MADVFNDMEVDPSIAAQDQHLSKALDELRTAKEWIIAIPAEKDGVRYVKFLVNASAKFVLSASITMGDVALRACDRVMEED